MLLYCIISSVLIGGLFLYRIHENDKDQNNWVFSWKVGRFVKVLSVDSPLSIKVFLILSFVPFINILYLILLILDYKFRGK